VQADPSPELRLHPEPKHPLVISTEAQRSGETPALPYAFELTTQAITARFRMPAALFLTRSSYPARVYPLQAIFLYTENSVTQRLR